MTSSMQASPRRRRRHVEQIVFPNMADAQAAADSIKSGTSFTALAAERGLKEQDIDLGTVAKSGIVDPTVADAAFSLKEGEVSAPVQGQFGAVIVTVLKIEPRITKSLAEVDAAAAQRHRARSRQEPGAGHPRQDRRRPRRRQHARRGGAEGKAAGRRLSTSTVPGAIPTASSPSTCRTAATSSAAAFATDVGVDNDPIDADGGYVWYDVAAITPARDRTLDEVKGPVDAALARRRDRFAAEDQSGRSARQAQERHPVRRGRLGEQPQDRNRERSQARRRRAATISRE